MSSSSEPRHAGSPGAPVLVQAQRRANWLYLLPVLGLPAAMFLAAFFVIPSHWFGMHSQIPYFVNFGYGSRLHNRTCDILIYGDSSAMIGIDPAILQQRTGLSACNVAEYAGMTVIVQMLPVDDFLANNPRPRFIVFLYSPEAFNQPSAWTERRVTTYEGITYLIQRRPLAKIALLLASHPLQYLSWAESGMRIAVLHLRSAPLPEATEHIRDTTGGRFPFPESTRTDCFSDTRYRDLPDPAYISQLRTRYGVDGTRVLVDATPTAPCDPSLSFYRQHLGTLIDDYPYPTIPLSYFSADGRLHVNHEGIPILTGIVADQINALTGHTGGN